MGLLFLSIPLLDLKLTICTSKVEIKHANDFKKMSLILSLFGKISLKSLET